MIRKAKEQDLKQLSRMYKSVFKVHNIFTKSEKEIEEYLKPLISDTIVAEEDGKIVGGLVIFRKQYGDWNLFNFKHVGVANEYQGKGIGSQLLKEAEKICKKGKVELRVAEGVSEIGTIAFYEKNGYKKEGELESHYRKGAKCFVMGKVL